MHKLVVAVGLLRAPLICMAVYIAALLPPQSREVFRAMREAEKWEFVVEIVRAGAFALALALVVLTTCALLMKHVADLRKSASNIHFELLEILAIGLAGIPLLSIWLLNVDFTEVAGTEAETVPLPRRRLGYQVNHLVYGATALAVAAGLGLLVWRGSLRSAIVSPFSRLTLPYGLGLGTGACLVGAVIVAVSVVAIQAPLWVAGALGPFGFLCLFLGILTIASSMMTAVYDRHGWPILSGLAAAALLFAYMGWSNNHEIRSVVEPPERHAKAAQPPKSQDGKAQSLAEKEAAEPEDGRKPGKAFEEWLGKRPDLAQYVGRPYPVYVVAAEGGGLRAAAHAASVLARLQDDCPGFARHLFAISGVSGGSLGAAVFTSLIDALPPGDSKGCEHTREKTTPLLPLVRRYFENDFLSPLLAYALFPDFLQRFLPLGFSQFDRARGLEAAFEEAWKYTLSQIVSPLPKTTAFGRSFRGLWSASASKPALLLNTTSVRDGNRIVLAPFILKDSLGFTDLRIDLMNKGEAITLSTAVGVSARFPVITPPGWKKSSDGTRFQIVDGGYYDNSGITTAAHLIDAIAQHARATKASQPDSQDRKHGTGKDTDHATQDGACAPNNMVSIKTPTSGRVTVCFKLIVISAPGPTASHAEHDEFTAPLFAAYNVLSGHEEANIKRIRNAYCGGKHCGQGARAEAPHIYVRFLTHAEIPLGWYFSKATLKRVLSASPPPTDCVPGAAAAANVVSIENACLAKRVRDDLS